MLCVGFLDLEGLRWPLDYACLVPASTGALSVLTQRPESQPTSGIWAMVEVDINA